MKGIFVSRKLRECVVKNGENAGRKFKVMDFSVDVKTEAGEVKTYKGTMSADYAKRYFEYCKTTTKDTLGKEVEIKLRKRIWTTSDGEERTVTEVKFMNLLDENGNPIVMPKEGEIAINF